MGYSTDFEGKFTLNKPLSPKLKDYLEKFSDTRRMARNNTKLHDLYSGRGGIDSDFVGLNPGAYGLQGEYFIGATGFAGQDSDASIVSYNGPASTQPGLWCQWVPTHDGAGIEWNGAEKFYNYVEWLEYLIVNFLAPNGYTLSGDVKWAGENREDIGVISVRKNKVTARAGKVSFPKPKRKAKPKAKPVKAENIPLTIRKMRDGNFIKVSELAGALRRSVEMGGDSMSGLITELDRLSKD